MSFLMSWKDAHQVCLASPSYILARQDDHHRCLSEAIEPTWTARWHKALGHPERPGCTEFQKVNGQSEKLARVMIHPVQPCPHYVRHDNSFTSTKIGRGKINILVCRICHPVELVCKESNHPDGSLSSRDSGS